MAIELLQNIHNDYGNLLPVSLPKLDQMIYGCKRRLDLARTFCDMKIDAPITVDRRESLTHIYNQLNSAVDIPYIFVEKEFPGSHGNVFWDQKSYTYPFLKRQLKQASEMLGQVIAECTKLAGAFDILPPSEKEAGLSILKDWAQRVQQVQHIVNHLRGCAAVV